MRKPKLWEWMTCTLIVLVVGMILWPVTICACASGDRIECLSKLKQQGMAVRIYAADWNDRLPNRDHWSDQIRGAIKYDKKPFDDRTKEEQFKGGYAYNAALSDRLDADFDDPAKNPLTYDSVNFGRNASDLVTSLPEPGRHKGRNNMSYLDGHAKGIPVKEGP
jgi:prepilin-type processing-associated H-X9-DG protein